MGLCLKKKMDYDQISPNSTVDTSSEGLTMYSDCSSTTESENSETFPGAGQIALAHYGSQQNLWAGETDRVKAKQTYKGQLKIAIYVNYGLLTAHVISGRHLKSKSGSTCNSYVKVSLMPDEDKRTRCKTEIASDSNNPLYDEKFSFELLDEDVDKRLFLSVWNKNGNKKSCEFLGCMSFGIRNISSQPITGYYYLLAGDIGKRKHLQVAESLRLSGGGGSGGGLMEVGNRNSISSGGGHFMPPGPQPALRQRDSAVWVDTHVVTVKRSCRGYGFTISGACPVAVCRVEAGSHAHRVGVRGGDLILKIDGMSVARTNADTVARIIRNSSKQVQLEIERPRQIEPMTVNRLEKSPRKPVLTSTPDRYDDRAAHPTHPKSSAPPPPLHDHMDVDPAHPGTTVSPWRLPRRHAPYPSPRSTPPRSPSVKSFSSSPGRLERNGAVYPSFDTYDYGWIDRSNGRNNNMAGGFDSDGFRVPLQMHGGNNYNGAVNSDNIAHDGFRAPLQMRGNNYNGGGVMNSDNIGHTQTYEQESYSHTLPRSMKFKTSSRTQLQTYHHEYESHEHQQMDGGKPNLLTKDYGWLDSKENLSTISSIHPHNSYDSSSSTDLSNHRLQTAYSTGTLQAHRKKVSFKDF